MLTTKRGEQGPDAPDLTYVSPSGQETPLTDEQLVEAAANTPPVGASAVATAGARQEATTARTSLPKTGSPLAGIGLLGLFSLLSAAALRFRA